MNVSNRVRRTVNTRWVLVLLALGLVSGGLFFVVHQYQMGHLADAFLREAERATEDDKPGDAIGYLQRYLSLAPDDADAWAKLGSALAETGQLRRAVLTFERVLRLDPNRRDVRRQLVQLAVDPRVGRYQDARAHLEILDPQHDRNQASPISGKDRGSRDGELCELRGICLQGLGEYAAAARSYEEAIQVAPERLEAYARLAQLLARRLESPREALKRLDIMVEKNADNPEAYMIHGRYLNDHRHEEPVQAGLRESRLKQDQSLQATAEAVPNMAGDREPQGAFLVLEAVMRDAEQAVSLAPQDTDAMLFAAMAAGLLGRTDEARSYAERALALSPQEALAYSTLADIELQQGEIEKAISWLKRGQERAHHPDDLLWNLANLLITRDEFAEAERVIEQLRTSGYTKPRIEYLEGRIQLEQEQWLQAQYVFESLRNSLAGWPELMKHVDFWLGKCYQELGKSDLQLTAYRRALDADPFWIPARLGLARALLLLGRVDECLDEYRYVSKLPGAPEGTPLQLVRLMILVNLRRARDGRDWQQVESTLQRLEQADVDTSGIISVLKAEVLVAQSKVEQAQEVLRQARERMPDKLAVWSGSIALAQRQRDWSLVEKLLTDAEGQIGDTVRLRLLRARYQAQRFGNGAAEKLRKLAVPPDEYTPEDRVQLAAGVARLSLAIRDFDQAEQLCQLVAEHEPNNLRIRLVLFDLALRAERETVMTRMLNDMQRIEGLGPLWRYGEAVRLTLQARRSQEKELFADAQKLLATVQVARPGWSRVPLLTAEILDFQDKQDAAIPNYLRAIELGERGPRTVRRTVQLLRERGRYLEADQTIRRLQEQQSPFSLELTRMAAEVSLRLEEFDRALEFAEETAAGSKDFRDHIWLGQILEVLGRTKEAEAALRHAKALASKVPETWISLIQFLHRHDRLDMVEQEIGQVTASLTPQDAPLALARIYELLEKLAEAELRYQQAMEQAPDDPAVVRAIANFYFSHQKLLQAEEQLSRLVSGPLEVSEPDRAWARRNLAIILAGRRDYQDYLRAVRLLDENLQYDPASTEDRRAKAFVLATRSSNKTRRDAIVLLEALVKRRVAVNPNDHLLLAKLYLLDKNWAKASNHLRRLAARPSKTARFKASYARALLDHEEPSEAELWIGQLEKLAPDATSTIDLRARALLVQSRLDEALTVLRQYADAADPNSTDLTARLLWVAARLERFGWLLHNSGKEAASLPFFEEAEKFFRRHVELRPDNRLNLAAFWARQGHVDAALKVIETMLETARPQDLAKTCIELFARSKPPPADLTRIEAVMKRAVEAHSRAIPLLIALAALRNQQAQFDEAEALFREVLDKESSHVMALNNLALLLVFSGDRSDEALELLNRALEIRGPQAKLLDSRGTAFLALGQDRSAIKDLQAAVNDGPSGVRYFHLAQAYLQTGEVNRAVRALREAQKLGLETSALHPLEHPAYRRVIAALARVETDLKRNNTRSKTGR